MKSPPPSRTRHPNELNSKTRSFFLPRDYVESRTQCLRTERGRTTIGGLVWTLGPLSFFIWGKRSKDWWNLESYTLIWSEFIVSDYYYHWGLWMIITSPVKPSLNIPLLRRLQSLSSTSFFRRLRICLSYLSIDLWGERPRKTTEFSSVCVKVKV